jgi:predicted ATPase
VRLDRVYIDGFKNLRDVEVDFDQTRLTTVVIGQNGSGKSNLIEAIVDVFRFADLNRGKPRFRYEVDYRLDGRKIRLSNLGDAPVVTCEGERIPRTIFEREKETYFPDLIFGYYSGGSRRLEQLFDSHQRRYYDAIKRNEDLEECRKALNERRLFYCRPIHGAFALLSFFAFPSQAVARLLTEKLGVTGFHSALVVFRQPSWFTKQGRRGRLAQAHDLWGAMGPAGICARAIRDVAFHPLALEDRPIDDYRDKGGTEVQLGAFLRSRDSFNGFSERYANDREFFAGLESMDISDLVRDLHTWVKRADDETGDVSFADLSDGERQLLMALGLIRISTGKRALFLLDEPDTHLNPHWQLTYLDLIRQWTEVTADESRCHIVMTSHNPLTVAALRKEEVRVMVPEEGRVSVRPPYTDPIGMGFTATLTEIFGLTTSLDLDTQRAIDERNELTQIDVRTDQQERRLIELNDRLNRLGFMFEDREPLYHDFLQAWKDVRYAERPPLSQDQLEIRRRAMAELIGELAKQRESA